MVFIDPDREYLDEKFPQRAGYRGKKYAITFDLLDRLFSLPQGASTAHIAVDHDRRILYFHVAGECFDEIPEGQEIPESRISIRDLVDQFQKIELEG